MVVLLFLFAVLLFIVGFRYGRYVEKIDKTYIPPISQTPQATNPTTSPAPTTTLQLEPFKHAECKINFFYPNYMSEEKISSQESQLTGNGQTLTFSCNRQMVFAKREAIQELQEAQQATISGQRVPLYAPDKDRLLFIVQNPVLGRSVYFETNASLLSLLQQTLRFER